MNVADDFVHAELTRRADVRRAILEVVTPAGCEEEFSLSRLRRHLAIYYGAELAESATPAELIGGSAVAGAVTGLTMIYAARLRKPSRQELRRIAAKWNKDIPPAEIPMIRRQRCAPGEEVDPESLPVSGSIYKHHGVSRQAPDQSTLHMWRDGGDNRGSSTTRRRRFPSYTARLRAFLDSDPTVSAVDRQILEHVVEGKTLQWIADELDMKKPTVHKRVNAVRTRAGISGPGAGR